MIPDFCEPLTGHRGWNINAMGFLCSANHNHTGRVWPAKKAMRARCPTCGLNHFGADGKLLRAPVKECSCGLYAYKPNVPNRDWSQLPITGEVKLWGRVIEHEHGYRAEYAYPSSLVAHEDRIAARLRHLYGVPCVVQALASLPYDDQNSSLSTAMSYGGAGGAYGSTSSFVMMSSRSFPAAVPPLANSTISPLPRKRSKWWKI